MIPDRRPVPGAIRSPAVPALGRTGCAPEHAAAQARRYRIWDPLLFRWFVGLSMDAPVWDATVYSKNRDRLVAGEVAARFLQAVLQGERVRRLLSDEHFSVDGTLIEA